MKKRQIKKVIKLYGDSWWKAFDEGTKCSYFLCPPMRWRRTKILNEFHRQHFHNGQYLYPISIS